MSSRHFTWRICINRNTNRNSTLASLFVLHLPLSGKGSSNGRGIMNGSLILRSSPTSPGQIAPHATSNYAAVRSCPHPRPTHVTVVMVGARTCRGAAERTVKIKVPATEQVSAA
eukprot:s4880_g2.t1